ncbi:MAG: hypothetical protein LBQ66_07965 [Planctomycetaceae bacterium]|nr:hypothetical protein [Planctomycetaceae bacterium]
MRINIVSVLLLCLGLFFVSGCGVPVDQVSGTITFEDGTPLTKGEVIFFLNGSEEYIAKGKIGSDGSYSLAEQKIGKESGRKGCQKGDYKVVIASTSTTEIVNNKTVQTHIIDQNYARKDLTPLSATIPGGNYNFKVKPYK